MTLAATSGCYLRTVTVDPLVQALGLAAIVLLACYVIWFASRKSGASVRLLAMTSFVGHGVVGIVVWYAFPAWISGDVAVYEAQALGRQDVTAGKEGFAILLGALYRAIGHAPAAGLLLNAVFMGLFVIVVARTARRLGSRRASTVAAVLAVLLPPFVWWGSQLLREPPMWILIALAADTAVAMAVDGLSWRRATWLLVTCLAMLTIRAPVAAVFAVSLALGLVLASAPRFGDHIRRMAMIAGAIALAIFLFPRLPALQSLQEEDSASIVHSRNYLATTAKTGFGEVAAPTTSGLFGQLPTALSLVTLGPLPWQLPASGLPAVADTLAWWFVLAWGVRGFGPIHRRFGRAGWLLILPAAALLVALALTLANFGIVIRMRAMVVVLLLPYAAVGLAIATERGRVSARSRPLARAPQVV